ncbi:MAG: hypothetical protein KIT66_08955 [Chitinophagaceae bacterium]|nr:hypothetical protein [Chitinophagaceae bacterium]MCZ2397213.1 hypothetical protein [Chitinophagales bacterium]
MKKVISFLMFVFCANILVAQNEINSRVPLPPPYIISADTATTKTQLPDSCWQMLTDSTGKMTLQEAISSDQFQNTSREIDYHFKTYWIRYRIKNQMNKDVQIALWADNISYSDFYVKTDDTNWQHFRSGGLVPYSKRNGLKSLRAILQTIAPGESIMVYQNNTYNYILDKPVRMSAGFSFEAVVSQARYAHYIMSINETFILGLMLLTVAINLYFFIIVREKEFLYFALFFLFYGLVLGSHLDDVILRNHPALLRYLFLLMVPPMLFSLIHSVRYFLKTFIYFPKWDKELVALSFVQAIVIWFTDIIPSITHNASLNSIVRNINFSTVILIYASLLVAAFLSRKNRRKDIRLVIYGLAPFSFTFLLSIVFALFKNSNYFNTRSEAFINFITESSLINNVINRICLVWMFIIFAYVLLLRFSMLRKKYIQEKLDREQERSAMIEQQKVDLEKQVAERTNELQQSLEDLKSTQKQLIQSEKMASLGELTAGIAHEIQNPLNFVNNFSDINTELIGEADQEIDKGNVTEAKAILNDIKENEEKINHHGKRADAIVKSMLQHSRTSSGQKEPTDINALCDEYLRLAYHGMRAKDKSFNCETKTEFDSSLPKINVVPPDIGRVLLNLINNALFTVGDKSKQHLSGYEPTVTIRTKNSGDSIEIIVKDNGNGIPEKIKDKIFQPFFTTKPTGQGTGLGLSLSYDIIKTHGGEIRVNSKEGEGTEFIIQLPI